MRFFFVFAWAVGLGLLVAAGPAAAQNASNATGAVENVTETPTPTENGTEIVSHDFERSIDRDLDIQGWTYHTGPGEFEIDLMVHNRTYLTITEARSLEDAGDAQINVFSNYVNPGEHKVNFSASMGASGEAAAILSTRRSFSQGRAVIISTGYVPDTLPLAQTDSTTGWLGGFAVLLSMTVLAGIKRVRDVRKEPKEWL